MVCVSTTVGVVGCLEEEDDAADDEVGRDRENLRSRWVILHGTLSVKRLCISFFLDDDDGDDDDWSWLVDIKLSALFHGVKEVPAVKYESSFLLAEAAAAMDTL